MSRPLRADLSMEALQHNLARVRAFAPSSKVMAIVKANAYGHGVVHTAQALQGAEALAVASIDEAVHLRAAGINTPIVLLEGFFSHEELKEIETLQLQCVVHSWEQLEKLEEAKFEQPVTVWLKIDTGMHRLGFTPKMAREAYERLSHCSWVQQPPQLMSHFATSQDPAGTSLKAQLALFNQTTADWSGERTLANSGAIMAWPDTHADWVRPGAMLYGMSPFPDTVGVEHGLQPVMTLRSEIIAVHDVPAGDQVGYGGYWTCPEAMRVGIVAAGYGDGYPYHICSETPILVEGTQTQVIGRVSMDMIAVDLRKLPDAQLGSKVVLWGDGLPVEYVARAAGVSPYTLLCGITQRVKCNVNWSVADEKSKTISMEVA